MDEDKPMELKFTTPIDTLRDVAVRVSSAAEIRGDRPILANIRVTAKDGELELSATDLKTGIIHKVRDATVESDGDGLINAAKFLQILKLFHNVTIDVSVNERGHFTIKAPGSNYKIAGDDLRDFPSIKGLGAAPAVSISTAELVRLLKQTDFAAAVESGRHLVNGILFELGGGRLRLVTTDNKRLAISQSPVACGDLKFAAVIPASCAKALLRVIGKDTASNVLIAPVDNQLIFGLPNATVSCNTLVGKFPPYGEALTIELNKFIDVSADEFNALLKRGALFEDADTLFGFEEGRLVLKTVSRREGESASEMPVEYHGNTTRICFNPKFISEGIDALIGERCRFRFESCLHAGMLKELAIQEDNGEIVEQDSYFYLVMPIQMPGEGEVEPQSGGQSEGG